jgi:ribosomal protein S18 acetylase RimI-like enzyme
MSAPGELEIRRLDGAEALEHVDGLAAVLHDCVQGGASVRYLAPFAYEEAREVVAAVARDVESGARVLLAAFLDERVAGSVQVALAQQPNSPHRAEIVQLLVHRSARRRGIAERLMVAAEREARAEGKTLLVLDAVTGGDAARLYERTGWTRVGEIPNYALYPDGRPCSTTYYWKAV